MKNAVRNMAKNYGYEGVADLVFPIHEMLNLPESTALQVETIPGPTTSVALRVTVPGTTARSYFIKTLKINTVVESHRRLGAREVRFYGLIDSLSPDPYPNIPKCVNAFISENAESYYLVLEDLSDSHQNDETINFSRLANWQPALFALADFHRCFTHQLTSEQIQAYGDTPHDVENYVGKLERVFRKFRADHLEQVAAPVLSLMADSIPLIRTFEMEKVKRIHQNKLTTILHRDAHLRNFLYPRSPDDPALIVDWQFWGLGIGAYDLRHLLGSSLDDELRSHQEDLVRSYYERYRDGLDVDYPWEQCWLDYRKGIIDNLFMPVWQYTGFGWDYERWGKYLARSVENFYALGCDQINLQR